MTVPTSDRCKRCGHPMNSHNIYLMPENLLCWELGYQGCNCSIPNPAFVPSEPAK